MRKNRKQIARQRRILAACVGVLTAATVFGFATLNSRVKAFEAAQEAKAVEPMHVVAIAAKPAPTATPAPVLYDVPLDADLQLHIIAECESKGVDSAVIVAMIERESCYTANAIGDNGNAFGMLQIWPKWHYQRMLDLGCTDLLDPFQNVTVGVDLLADILENHGGDYSKALTAYNAGAYRGTVTEYAKAVLAVAAELKGGETA